MDSVLCELVANDTAMRDCFVPKSYLFVSLLAASILTALPLPAQEATVAFYNVENLFDIRDDSLKQDEEFLPYGLRGWTYERLQTKYRNVYKVIAGIDPTWQPPALVALAEVENRAVVEGLLHHTPLHRQPYRIIHEESPDVRGIDVALPLRLYSVSVPEPRTHCGRSSSAERTAPPVISCTYEAFCSPPTPYTTS